MLVVLASPYDIRAKDLVTHWKDSEKEQDICLLTCKDLSIGGWRHYLNSNSNFNSTSVIAGKEIPTTNIKGVFTRLTYVSYHELPHIILKDREYVASEMMAFLVCWLSFLKCPVLNRPTTSLSLCGPNWRQEEWIHAASKVGISVLRAERRRARKQPPATMHNDSGIQPEDTGDSNRDDEDISNSHHHGRDNSSVINRNDPSAHVTITVVGNLCLADPAVDDQDLVSKSLRLARLAGVDLLSIKYEQASSSTGEYLFASADPCPSIFPGTCIEKAVLDYFRERM
jgi:hypothetical protein